MSVVPKAFMMETLSTLIESGLYCFDFRSDDFLAAINVVSYSDSSENIEFYVDDWKAKDAAKSIVNTISGYGYDLNDIVVIVNINYLGGSCGDGWNYFKEVVYNFLGKDTVIVV